MEPVVKVGDGAHGDVPGPEGLQRLEAVLQGDVGSGRVIEAVELRGSRAYLLIIIIRTKDIFEGVLNFSYKTSTNGDINIP